MRTGFIVVVFAAFCLASARGQTFERKVFEGPDASYFSRYHWADFNADGAYDILDVDPYGKATLYISDGGVFNAVNLEFENLYFAEGRCAFNDYDGDGDVDILASEDDSIVIVNFDEDNGATLVNTGITFTYNDYGKIFWLDLDGDLVLDIIHGRKIFLNRQGVYSESEVLLPEYLSNMVLDDINGDGLPDIVAGGYESYDGTEVSIFLNEGGGHFAQTAAAVLPVSKLKSNTIALIDVDGDSDVDVFALDLYSRAFIFKNSLAQSAQMSFASVQISSNMGLSLAVVGDVNSDGLQDIVFRGENLTVLRNTSAGTTVSFASEAYDLQLDHFDNLDIVDINGDNKPDINVKGYSYDSGTVNLVFENVGAPAGPAPPAPENISSTVERNVTLLWDAVPGLLYDIEVKRDGVIYRPSGTSSAGRLLVPSGNYLRRTGSSVLRGLPGGAYEWRVQAVDPSGRSSAFSVANSFDIADGPSALTLEAFDLVNVQLCWSYAGGDNPSFAVFRATSSNAAEEIAQLGPGVSCYEDHSVPPNKKVEYFVVSVNDGVYSAPSNSVVHHSALFVKTSFGTADPNIITARCFPADYDMDGDYDLEFTGRVGSGSDVLLKNDGVGSFIAHGSVLPSDAIRLPYLETTGPRDLDNDGDPDFVLITGQEYSWQKVSVFINNNGTFAPGFETPQYLGIQQVIVEDMNNDGRPDLIFSRVVGNSSGNPHQYEFLYQTADGGFEDSHIRLSETETSTLTPFKCVDLNNDGFLDILWFAAGKKYTDILVNEEGMGFTRRTSILPVNYAMGVSDYTGDGIVDVMVRGNEGLNLYFGAGDFTFTEPKVIPIDYLSGGPDFVHADIDLNGLSDLLLSDGYNAQVVLNRGSGSFKASDIELQGNWGTTIAITDFENDGDIDIVKLGNDGQHQGLNYLYKNQLAEIDILNAPPTAPGALTGNYALGKTIFSWPAATDDRTPAKLLTYNLRVIDSNGKVWLSAETNESGSFRRRMAPGNAGYSTVRTMNDLPAGIYIARVQAIDASFALSPWSEETEVAIADGPSALEIERLLLNKVQLTWSESVFPGTEVVVERRTAGTLWEAVAVLPAGTTTYVDADLDHNRLYKYRVFESSGTSTTAPSNIAEWSTNMWVLKDTDIANLNGYMDIADFTGDGKMDMVFNGGMIYNGYTEDITRATFENTAAGWVKQDITPSGLLHTAQIAFRDLNGDHKVDVYQHGMNASFVYKTETFQNNGDKSFSQAANVFTQGTYAIQAYYDYDGDNDLDVFATKAGSYPVIRELYKNNGGGDYSSVDITGCNTCSQYVAVADFDQDGDEDVVQNVSGTYRVHLNTPDGLVADASFPAYETRLAVTDYNSDGLPDVVLLSFGYQRSGKIYKNLGLQANGAIAFEELPTTLASGQSSLLSADLDHDGDTDIALLSPKVSVLLNLGNDTFEQYDEPGFSLGTHMGGLIDFDDDGDLDIYVSGYHISDGSVYGRKGKILLNQTIVSENGITNAAPLAPQNLGHTQDSLGVHLTWSIPADDHTTPGGITYDVVLMREGKIVTKGDHDPATGQRLRLSRGRSTGVATLNNLSLGAYTWRVQAIDGSFAASGFSEEATFIFLPAPPVINDTLIYRCGREITLTAQGTGIEWYRDENLTQLLARGEFHPEETQTVYATQTIDGYRGIPERVRITIVDKPAKPAYSGANPFEFCGSGSYYALWVSGDGVQWYSDEALTKVISSTNSVQLQDTITNYYAIQMIGGCRSDALAIAVQRTTIDSKLYATSDRIYTRATDGNSFYWYRNGLYFQNTNVPYIPFDGKTATYVVIVVKGQCQQHSEPFISSPDNITAVEETPDAMVSIFPNPATSQLTIRFKQTHTTVKIFDTLGKLVYESFAEARGEQVIDVRHWTNGVYMVIVGDQKGGFTKRLIIL